MATRHVIGDQAWVALARETDAPGRSTEDRQDRSPRTGHAHREIILPGTQATAQCPQFAPILRLEQRLGPSPDIRVISNNLAKIWLAGRDGRARGNRQQVDLRGGISTFQCMYKCQ